MGKRSLTGLCLVGLWTTAASAQEPVPTEPAPTTAPAAPEVTYPALPPVTPVSQGREMNGHAFIPSELLIQPFVQTIFRSVTAGAVVRSNAPALNIRGGLSVTREDFRQYGYSQLFELQVKLLPWLAVRGSATALIFSGVSGRSVLNLGTTAALGAGGGVTIGHRFGNALQLAIVGDAAFEPTYNVNVGGAIANSIINNSVQTGNLVTRDDGLPLRFGVAGAYAPFAPLGFQAVARYEHAFRLGGSLSREDAFVGAGAVDFDLKAISVVPIGFIAAYQVAVPFGVDDRTDLWHYLDAGIFYTGRRELALGIEGSARRFPQRNTVNSDGIAANVVVRYYWQ